MPKIRVIKMGITHTNCPGARFRVELWGGGDVPDRLDSLPTSENDSWDWSPRVQNWVNHYLSRRKEWIPRHKNGLEAERGRSHPHWFVLLREDEPETNEYGEVSP